MIIDVYSHHYAVTVKSLIEREICMNYVGNFVEYGIRHQYGKFIKDVKAVYAVATANRTEFRFHKNTYKEFIEHLDRKGYVIDKNVTVRIVDGFKPAFADIVIKDKFKPRDYQLPMIDYIDSDKEFKLIPAQTGTGKSITTLFGLERIKQRTVFILRPQFVEKWVLDILEKCEITEDRLMVVRGNKHLKKLLELGVNGLITEDIILISNRTILTWFKDYREHGDGILDMGYDCLPHELCKVLGVGVRVIDEVHMDLHLQMRIDLFTHVNNSVSLTATLMSDSAFLRKMQELMYPIPLRYKANEIDKYINAFAVHYRLDYNTILNVNTRGQSSYSHMEFEKSVMSRGRVFKNYVEVIEGIVKDSFFVLTRPVKKLLIYVSTVDMATILTDYLCKKNPTMDIRRYCEDDSYDNLLESEICVTTLLSAGTGHDVQNLTTVIMTTALASTSANIQAIGRLRKLSDDHPVEFYYLTCDSIPKHTQYSEAKKTLFKQYAKSFNDVFTGVKI